MTREDIQCRNTLNNEKLKCCLVWGRLVKWTQRQRGPVWSISMCVDGGSVTVQQITHGTMFLFFWADSPQLNFQRCVVLKRSLSLSLSLCVLHNIFSFPFCTICRHLSGSLSLDSCLYNTRLYTLYIHSQVTSFWSAKGEIDWVSGSGHSYTTTGSTCKKPKTVQSICVALNCLL